MTSLTVRISDTAHKLLSDLSRRSGQTMQTILDKALEDYRRKCFLEGLAADFGALRADAGKWADEQAERRDWDATIADGVDDEGSNGGKSRRPRGKKR